MAETPGSLLPFYNGWDTYQELLIKALEPLSPEQLSLEAAPHLRSLGQLASHIVGTRAGWLYYVLETGQEYLVPLAEWNQRGYPVPPVAELIDGLRVTWQVIQDALAGWSIADMAVQVRDVDENGEEQIYTRQWVLWHLIEHDLHHGGELSFTLGMHGLHGIDL